MKGAPTLSSKATSTTLPKTFFTSRGFIIFSYTAIALLALFLHLFRLGSVPNGLHVDELGMAYDAFSLANWGVTRELTSWPVYLANYGGGQSALYAWLAMPFIQLFGLHTAVLRLPGALLSLATILFGTLLVRARLGKRAALPAALLFTILPVFLMQGRFGLDCNLLLPLSTTALYLLHKAISTGKARWFTLTGLTLGISLYAYALSYTILPLFLLLTLAYLLYIKRLGPKNLLCLALPLALLAAPLIAFVLINSFDLPAIRLGGLTIPRIPRFRAGNLTLAAIPENFKTILEAAFFTDWLNYNALPGHYTLYLVSIPFAVKGFEVTLKSLTASLRGRFYDVEALLLFWLTATVATGLLITTADPPNINKLNAMYFVLAYMALRGLVSFLHFVRHKRAAACTLAALYTVSFFAFAHSYFITWPTGYASFFFPELSSTIALAEGYSTEGQPVYYTSPNAGLYYAYAKQLSPYEIDLARNIPESHCEARFNPPEEPDYTALYVVWPGDEKQVEQLVFHGFTLVADGPYQLFAYIA